MRKLIFLFLLSSCIDPTEQKEELERCQQQNGLVLISTSPDGVKLWRVVDCNTRRYVYFSSAGVQFQQREGKIEKAIQVPNK